MIMHSFSKQLNIFVAQADQKKQIGISQNVLRINLILLLKSV